MSHFDPPESNSSESTSRNRRSASGPIGKKNWRIRILVGVGFVFLISIGSFFMVTSNAFINRFILPNIGAMLDADISSARIYARSIGFIEVQNLVLMSGERDPLLKVKSLAVHYDFLECLKGNFKVNRFTMDSAEIRVIKNADGSTNYDSILAALLKTEDNSPSGDIPQILVKDIEFKQCRLYIEDRSAEGGSQVLEITELDVRLDQLGNNRSGRLTMEALLNWDIPDPDQEGSQLDRISADISSTLNLGLTADLIPESMEGKSTIVFTEGSGVYQRLQGFSMMADARIKMGELSELSFYFEQEGNRLGEIRTLGRMDASNLDADLNLSFRTIESGLLEALFSSLEFDFGSTGLNGKCRLQWKHSQSLLSIYGQATVRDFSVSLDVKKTPTLNLDLQYQLESDFLNGIVTVKDLKINGRQGERKLLEAGLDQAMTFSWSGNESLSKEALFHLNLNKLKLDEWTLLTGDLYPGGELDLELEIHSTPDGESVQVEFEGLLLDNGIPSIEVDGSIQYNFPRSMVEVQSELKLELNRLIPAEARSGKTLAPVSLDLNLSVAVSERNLTLLKSDMVLENTDRVTDNRISMTGAANWDEGLIGKFQLESSGLDITEYAYVFLESGDEGVSQNPEDRSNEEPPPIQLPVKKLGIDVDFKKIVFRDITLVDFQLKARIESSHVLLDPVEFTLDDSTVHSRTEINLSVPGYEYEFDLKTDSMPIRGIVDSFFESYRGKIKARMSSDISIQGKGVTGAGLRRSLIGNIDIVMTNATVEVVSKANRRLLTPIALGLGMPEILKPSINYLNSKISVENGTIKIDRILVQSPAFRAVTSGTIPMSMVFTDSPVNLPIKFLLPKHLAAKLSPTGLKSKEDYVPLPDFAALGGTIGAIQTRLNKVKMAQISLGAIVGLPANIGGRVLETAGNASQKAAQQLNKVTKVTQGILNVFQKKTDGDTNSVDEAKPGLSFPFKLPFKKKE